MSFNTAINIFFKLKIILLSLLVIILNSCNNGLKKEVITEQNLNPKSFVKYAKGFDIQDFDTYKKLIIKTPYPGAKNQQEFILIKSDVNDNNIPNHQNSLTIPLSKIVATSTTHIPMLELIGAENSLIGFPNTTYITSPKTSLLIKNGHIQEIGNDQSINTEILLTLEPDAVIAFSMGNTSKMFNTINKNGIPVIYNGDWLEETPLGRAEWIKFFGALYDKDDLADSIFKTIENKYQKAKQIAKKAQHIPTILTGVLYKDKWNLPAGESFMAQLYKDANTDYLWKTSKGQGSLILSFESVFEKAQKADFWIGSGYFTNRNELGDANDHYTEFTSFKNRNIYTFSNKKGDNGGVIYFELGPVQPHIVLQDLIKVTHPELLPDYKPYFLEKLGE